MSRMVDLPPRVERELQKEKWVAERARQRSLVRELFDFDDAVCKEWAAALRAIDPHLRLGRAKPQAHESEFGYDITPGFYHIVRFNQMGPPSFYVVDNGDGGFVYPNSGMLDELRRNDLQNPAVWREQIGRRAMAEQAHEKEKEEKRAARVADVIDRYKAKTDASVSMSDTGWSNSNAGRKGRKA